MGRILPATIIFGLLTVYFPMTVGGQVARAAFVEPSVPPPAGNIPVPISAGPEAQSKAGDLEVENLKVRDGIELGGVVRKTWPASSVGCTWQGTKCNCVSNDSSIGFVRMTIGSSCNQGQITGFRIMNLDISSKYKNCSTTAPAGCTPGLYTYSKPLPERRATLKGAITVITNVVVRVVRWFRKLF